MRFASGWKPILKFQFQQRGKGRRIGASLQGKSERKKAEGEMDGRRQTITAEQITARLRANRRVEEVEEVEAAAGGAGGLRGG